MKDDISKVYPMYTQKAEKKGRTKDEVDTVIYWLTCYAERGLQEQIEKKVNFEMFFFRSPSNQSKRRKNHGGCMRRSCGGIDDPLIKNARRLDKLVDELAKGKAMEKILRS